MKEFGGAFLECWIKGSTEKDAKVRAMAFIEKQGWNIVKLDESCIVDTDHDHVSPESMEYCRNAEEEGECYVFHVWPAEAQEEEGTPG